MSYGAVSAVNRGALMQIFLSYASEDKAVAEPIAFSLRARGHKVFLDRDDLPAGGEYDQKIEQAVAQSGLFVFLISPQSVGKGRFTLSELEFARRKWLKPDGHVLPVMVAPTTMADVPSFLKSVTILEPKGNVAAEVASAVEPMVAGRDRRTLYVLGGLGLLSGLLTNPAQQLVKTIVGDMEIHNHITVDRLLSGLALGIALLAGLAYLMRFKPRMVLIPLVVLLGFFLAMETWVTLAPVFSRDGGATAVDTSALQSKCSELASSTGTAPTDPALQQACAALAASEQKVNQLQRIMSLPGAGMTYGLAGLIGALVTYLGTASAVGRAGTAAGSLLTSAIGAIMAGTVGMLVIGLQLDGPLGEPLLFATWQSAVAVAIGRLVR